MKRSFWFHYNKPASRIAGAPRLTIHWKGACHIVTGIRCLVPTESRIRRSQPHVVIAGKAEGIEFNDGQALVK